MRAVARRKPRCAAGRGAQPAAASSCFYDCPSTFNRPSRQLMPVLPGSSPELTIASSIFGVAVAAAVSCACMVASRWSGSSDRANDTDSSGATEDIVKAELERLQRRASERGAPALYERSWAGIGTTNVTTQHSPQSPQSAQCGACHHAGGNSSISLRVMQFNIL